MKLEFLDNDSIVRLFGFDSSEAQKLKTAIENILINHHSSLNLASLNFITPVNCSLAFIISESNKGITTTDKKLFTCDLNLEGYREMVNLMEPFCNKESPGYQWLYDIADTPFEFLFSPTGKW